jgi:hypothetical protein
MTLPSVLQKIVFRIRQEKAAGTRSRPSAYLVDRSSLLTAAQRRAILDKIASLVDENLCGRSEMCVQFAALLSRALTHLMLSARPVCGQAIYYDDNRKEIFRWSHAWVRVGQEVIDGNVDCLSENPTVPDTVRPFPYWGPIQETPVDRKLRENHGAKLPSDSDVEGIWWPDLQAWLDGNFPTVCTSDQPENAAIVTLHKG